MRGGTIDLLGMSVDESLFVGFLINIETGDDKFAGENWKVQYGPRAPDDGGSRIDAPNAEPVKLTRTAVDQWSIETLTGAEGSAKAALTQRVNVNGELIHQVQNYYDMPFKLVLTAIDG